MKGQIDIKENGQDDIEGRKGNMAGRNITREKEEENVDENKKEVDWQRLLTV